MPVPHHPARRPGPSRRSAPPIVPVVAALGSLAAVLGTLPVVAAATTGAPPASRTSAASPPLTTAGAPSSPTSASASASPQRNSPTAEAPCPEASPAGRPPSSCAEPAASTDPPATRCHRKTVELLARAGDTRKLVVEGSLTLRWCSRGTERILRTSATFAGEARDGLAIAVARRPRIRHRGPAADVADVRFRVTGRPRADVYAATTPGAVLRSRRRALAGRPVDQRLTLRLTVRAGGRASARCTGRLVACRVTPADR